MQLCKPAHFSAAHGGALGGRVVVGAGEMVKAVGNVEGEFGVDAIVLRSFTHGTFDVDDEVAGSAFFAGDGFTAETDDVSRAVFTEKFAVILRNARIVRQQQGDFLPDGFRIGGFEQAGNFSGQPADCRQVDPGFLPVYQNGFHL